MKFGTRLVLYYSLISMTVLLIVGSVAIRSIERYWMHTVEQQLAEQNQDVQDYIQQVVLFENQKAVKLTEVMAKRVTSNLSSGVGQLQIYNNEAKLLSGLGDIFEDSGFDMAEFQKQILQPVQQGTIVNCVYNHVYYHAAPIPLKGKTAGILVVHYRLGLLNLVLDKVFYILFIGAAVFCLVIIFVSIYTSWKVVSPIRQLVDITARYAKRDFTMVDIRRKDELGQLSKSINDMGLQLQDYISRQKQFISNISHEIRTPLTAIKGYSEYLADEVGGNPDVEKAIHHLNHETARLTALVNDFLQLSRLDAYQEKFTFQRIDLSALLGDAAERMKDRAQSHGVEFYTDIKPELFVNGDRDKLIQVIVNLLDNSIKYSPAGGRVKIKLAAVKNQALLTVADQGIGIPEEELDKVFDRFYRASNVRGITGTGLGLAISKEIIVKHLGEITMGNALGGGTEVRINLPLLLQM